jgi:hypothetical protein
LLQGAREVLQDQPATATASIGGVVGAVVMVYGDNGPRGAAGCFDQEGRAAVLCAAEKLRPGYPDFGMAETDRVSIHLLRKLNAAKPLWWRDLGFGHSRGLYSALAIDKGGARVLTDTQMHVGGFGVEAAFRFLRKKGAGVPVSGDAPNQGLFLAPTESYTEYQGRPVALYRASTIMPPPEPSQIVEYCKLAGDYLVKILQPNNKWLYEGDLGRDKYFDTYNLLRHAGTIYALYQLYHVTHEARYRETADNAWKWLIEQIDRDKDDAGRPCAYPVEGKLVKLGGTGLTLIALAERLRVEKTEADLELGRALANHIVRSQNPDGSFQSYWSYKGKPAKQRRSIYYPGEAMLGLMRFYAHDPDPRYLETVERGAAYHLHERWRILGMDIFVPLDAWLMIALDELDRVKHQDDYVDYCLMLADQMINDQIDAGWETFYPDYHGGYFPYPPGGTPAGSRGEGLTACYLAALRAGRDVTELREAIARATRFQIERIVRPEFAHLYPNPRRALGAIRESTLHNGARIDNNQHNISSLLVAAEILSGK